MRNSDTDPIRIDAVELTGGGTIGLTFCPGKRDPYARGGGWWRDLDTDLDAIRDWGARALLCLLEQHELDLLGVTGLEAAVRARGIQWLHLPIRDVDVPDERFETDWPSVSERLRRQLAAGQRVLVHCRGGLGRSGLVAARLLVELGTAPADAVARVRRARPGAIETRAQENYVLRCAGI